MARVRIKKLNPRESTKSKLLEILSTNLIYATTIIATPDSYIVLTETDKDIDTIFQQKCQEELKENNFEPILPPELRAKRTIILFNVDDYILSHNDEDIKDELTQENGWLNEGIESIFRIPRTKILKLCLNETTTAKAATEKGLLAFHMSIPSYNIKIEEFIPVLTCMRCYAIEDHTTNKCPKPKDHTICSECGSMDHTWRQCNSTTKKCANCAGDHRTLANKCPKRKEAKEKKRKAKQTGTYSQATKANLGPNVLPQASNIFNRETAAKILTSIIHAHLTNIANPGTYNTELNKVFALNNLPNVNLPDNPPSKKIISLAVAAQDIGNTNQAEKNTEEEEKEREEGMKEAEEEEMKETEGEEEEVDVETVEKTAPTNKISGRAIGLHIITKSSTGWPKKTLFHKNIIEGIHTGKYKFIYTDSNFEEEQISKLLENNRIDLDSVWTTEEDSIFRKIRNGLIPEKSPATKGRKMKRQDSI